jgi:large subunit ribosomal protein L29
MPTMKKLISEIRSDDSKELQAKLNDLHKEQFNLRFKGAGANTNRHREVRRTIARILTVFGERARSGDNKQ